MADRRVVLSWSSGKDSAWALKTLRETPGIEVVALLTTVAEQAGRVPMHHVAEHFLERQVAAAGLPLIRIPLPSPCPNEVYEARMRAGLEAIKEAGAREIAFGDLFLEDIRAYRERMLEGSGVSPLFPLWKRDTAELAREMVAGGLEAIVTAVDTSLLDEGFVGRRFDDALLDALPDGVDPCAENGEFHSFACAGPMFAAPLRVRAGAKGRWERIVYVDLEDA